VTALDKHPVHFHPMDKVNAQVIIDWRYEAPYDFYNVDPTLAEQGVQEYIIPENAYYSIHDASDELIGYCCFGQDARVPGGDYQDDALDVGLGLRPDLTGNGYGQEFVQAILNFGLQQYAPQAFRMTVAAFNVRAIRVYEKLGFTVITKFTKHLDGAPFILMIKLIPS